MITALGFKSVAGAEATIAGVDLLRHDQMENSGEMTLWGSTTKGVENDHRLINLGNLDLYI